MGRKQQLKNIIAKVREANTLDKRSFERAELEKKVLEILNKHIRVEGAEGDELYIDDFKDIIKDIASLFEPYIKLVEAQDKFLSRLKLEFYEKCGESFAHEDWFKSFLKEIAELKKQLK